MNLNGLLSHLENKRQAFIFIGRMMHIQNCR